MSLAALADGKLEAKVLSDCSLYEGVEGDLVRILTPVDSMMLFRIDEDDYTAVLLRGQTYPLAKGRRAIAAGGLTSIIVVIGEGGDYLYDPRTLKLAWHRESRNDAAAFDAKRGRVYVAGDKTLRSWTPLSPIEETLYGDVKEFIGGLSIDGQSRKLYSMGDRQVRSWLLKD